MHSEHVDKQEDISVKILVLLILKELWSKCIVSHTKTELELFLSLLLLSLFVGNLICPHNWI